MRRTRTERLVGPLLIGGLVLVVVGLLAFFMLSGAGVLRYLHTQGDRSNWDLAGFGLLVALVGVLSSLSGLAIGLKVAFQSDKKAPPKELESVYVVAKTALSRHGQDVFDLDMYEDDELKLYVRLQFPDGTVDEFRTMKAVYETIGEGMRGSAMVQGRWLGAFRRHLPPPMNIQPFDA